MDNIDLCETPVSHSSGSAKNYSRCEGSRKEALDAVRRVIDFGHPSKWSYSAQKRNFVNVTNRSFTKEESPKSPMLQRYLGCTETPTKNFRFVCGRFGDSPTHYIDGDVAPNTEACNVGRRKGNYVVASPLASAPPKKVIISSGETPTPKNPNIIELVDRAGIKKPVIEENGDLMFKSRLRSSRSTIRNRVPCGQTRRLTSLFESIAEANKEQGLVQRRRELRTKSVPPPRFCERKVLAADDHEFSKDDSCYVRNVQASPFGDRMPKAIWKPLNYRSNYLGSGVRKVEIMKSEEGVKSLARKLENAGFVCSPSPSVRDMQSPIQTLKHHGVQRNCVTPLCKTKEFDEYDAVDDVRMNEVVREKPLREMKSVVHAPDKPHLKQFLGIKDDSFDSVKPVDEFKVLGMRHSAACTEPDVSAECAGNSSEWNKECVELNGDAVTHDRQPFYEDRTTNVPGEQCIEVCDGKSHLSENHSSTSQISCEQNVESLAVYEPSKVSRDASVNEIDQIGIVDKAFNFVNEVDRRGGSGISELVIPKSRSISSRHSSDSLPKDDASCSEVDSHTLLPESSQDNRTAAFSVFLKDERNKLSDTVPKVSLYSTSDKSLKGNQEEERYVNLGKKREQEVVSTKPLASSTPVTGSPSSSERVKGCGSTLNRTFISSISNSVCSSGVHNTLDLETEIKRLKRLEIHWENEAVKAQGIITRRRKSTKGHNGEAELFAQRDLLLAREHQVMLQREIQHIRELRLSGKPWLPSYKGDRGRIIIYSITVRLNRNFCLRNADTHDSYAFVVLMKTGDAVEATELVTLMDTRTMRVSSVRFEDQIQFGNLASNFSLRLEVYALKVRETSCIDERSCTLLKNKAKLLLSPLRKTNINGSVIGTSGFTSCGYTHLNKESAGDIEVYLDETEYPLEGTINVKSAWSSTSISSSVNVCGFLAMYEVIAELGSWSRYWAVLQKGVIKFWKDPNDEASDKSPILTLDLSCCQSETVTPCSVEECYRRNTFVVNFMVHSSQSRPINERIFLSADSKEWLDTWIDALNRSLKSIGK